MEIPAPWTSYKGIGSIVCFLNHTTGKTTWKHPFYDYFVQLREFGTRADPIRVKQCRLNRLIWSYEAQGPAGQLQEPLIGPEYIECLAEIMNFNLAEEPYLVRDLKNYLKIFAQSYRTHDEVSIEDVIGLQEAAELNRSRVYLVSNTWKSLKDLPTTEDIGTQRRLYEEENEIIRKLQSGEVSCVECQNVALSYCTMFQDYFCLPCFARLHQRGHRKEAKAYKLEVCSQCRNKAAKLECNYTKRLFCAQCFAMVHIKSFPQEAKEIAPQKIHYHKMAAPPVEDDEGSAGVGDVDSSVGSEAERVSQEWIPFFDAKGIQYFYNFSTGERMRRSPRASPEKSANSTPRSTGLKLDSSMSGLDMQRGFLGALNDEPSGAAAAGSTGRKNRLIKAPPPMLPRPIHPPYRTNPLAKLGT